MIFTLKVPFTQEHGPNIGISILDADGTVVVTGSALIATGSSVCLMHGGLANRVGLHFGETYTVAIASDAGQVVQYPIVFDRLRPGRYEAEIVLGMTFLAHFSVHIDGPYQVATLSGEIP